MKIVIKIGTSSITGSIPGTTNTTLMQEIAEVVHKLKKVGHQVVLVSSGAVGLGCGALNWQTKPKLITSRQAAASIGQILLARFYEEHFHQYNQLIGQVLLTRMGMQDKERYLNARLTLKQLLSLGVLPIVNENDVVADEEIKFSDNDYLSAVVAELIEAEHLFILTDTEGLFTEDPRTNPQAKLISLVEEIDSAIEAKAGLKPSSWGTGGMVTKIEAAKMATSFGTTVHIIAGQHASQIQAILEGKLDYGTTFLPRNNPIDARKAWIACGATPKGKLIIDAGALNAINQGKSLLPVGIKKIQGKFGRGHILSIYFEEEAGLRIVAKGLTKYDSDDLRKIKGSASEEIENILGYSYGHSAIHRDDLAVIAG